MASVTLNEVVLELQEQNKTLDGVATSIRSMLDEDIKARQEVARRAGKEEEARREAARDRGRVKRQQVSGVRAGIVEGAKEGLGLNLLKGMAGGLAGLMTGLIPGAFAGLSAGAILGTGVRILTRALMRAGIITILANYGQELFEKLLNSVDITNENLTEEQKENFAGALNLGTMALLVGSTIGGLFGKKYALILGAAGAVGSFMYTWFEKKFDDTAVENAFNDAFDTQFGSEIMAGIGTAVGLALGGALALKVTRLVRGALGLGTAATAATVGGGRTTPKGVLPTANVNAPPGESKIANKKFSMGTGLLASLFRVGLPAYAISSLDATHQQLVDTFMAQGMSREEARQAAAQVFSENFINTPGIKQLTQVGQFQKNLAAEYGLPQLNVGPYMGAPKFFDYLRSMDLSNLFVAPDTSSKGYYEYGATLAKQAKAAAAQKMAEEAAAGFVNEFTGLGRSGGKIIQPEPYYPSALYDIGGSGSYTTQQITIGQVGDNIQSTTTAASNKGGGNMGRPIDYQFFDKHMSRQYMGVPGGGMYGYTY
jgi:hypothetical protein